MDIKVKVPKLIDSPSNNIKNDQIIGISTTFPINVNKFKQKESENFNDPFIQKLYDPEEEMKQIQKYGPPRINTNKLPLAFQNPVNQKNRPQKAQIIGVNKNIMTKVVQDFKLENCEAINEYNKQASQMNSSVKQSEQQIKKIHSNNPITPLKNFIKSQQRINEELGLNLSAVATKYEQRVTQKQLIQESIQLEEMITTEILRNYSDQKLVKKMIHAPSLKIYIVKEVIGQVSHYQEPLQNKEIRKNFKEWILFWQNKFGNSNLHIKVYSTFWNIPEGSVSIVTEYMNRGSLQNLLESVGYLPERAIKQICQQIIRGLQQIHNNGQLCHGALSPSQILFNSEGQVKLSLGISNKVLQQNSDIFNQQLLGKSKDFSLYNPIKLETPNLWNKGSFEIKQAQNDQFNVDKANDIWKLGLLLLNCAIGTLEFHPKTLQLYEGFRIILEEFYKYADQLKDTCCIIHSENVLIALVEEIQKKQQHISINNQKNVSIN